MKVVIIIGLLLLAVFFLNAQNLLDGPQKVVIDTEHSRYLVSNYYTGDIVQIDSAGNQAYFVLGANFVDGLEIEGNIVYGVGQNRKVRAYDLTTKELVMDITIDGSSNNYLSSITSDSAGHLFISCPALHTIYKLRISDEAYWIFAENNGLNRPNGILLENENNRIVVIDDSPNTSIIHAISLSDSTVSDLMTNNFNNPDGIVRDKDGFYYVGGYYLPGLYKIAPDFSGEPELFFEGSHMVYPTYNLAHHSLLITYYGDDDWAEILLSSTSIGPKGLYNEFVLNPTYPNPFSDNTLFSYKMENSEHAKLEVYDTAGKIIKILVNEQKPPGIYSIAWDGKDEAGKKLPNGIYYIRLIVNSFTETQKVILVR